MVGYSKYAAAIELVFSRLRNQKPNIQGHVMMVYFWTYAHPLYCPSDLQARGFNSCGRSDAL